MPDSTPQTSLSPTEWEIVGSDRDRSLGDSGDSQPRGYISTGFIENLTNSYFRVSKFIPQTPNNSNENALRTSFVPQTSIHLITALSHIFCVTRSHNLFCSAAGLLPHRPKTSPPVPLDPAHVPPHSGKLEHMRNGSAHGHAASAPARGAPKQPPAHLVLPLYFG